jgi:hypothetical protein
VATEWTSVRIRRATAALLHAELTRQTQLYFEGRSDLPCSDRHGITADTLIRHLLCLPVEHRARARRSRARQAPPS